VSILLYDSPMLHDVLDLLSIHFFCILIKALLSVDPGLNPAEQKNGCERDRKRSKKPQPERAPDCARLFALVGHAGVEPDRLSA